METRKDRDQLEKSKMCRNKKEFKEVVFDPLFYSLVVFCVVAICEKLGYDKWSIPSTDPVSWKNFISNGLLKAFFSSAATFIFLCLWKLKK